MLVRVLQSGLQHFPAALLLAVTTLLPAQDRTVYAGTYTNGDITLPRVDAIAAKDQSGKFWLELTNIDPNNAVEIEVSVTGINVNSATGETLAADKVDTVNTFDAPIKVTPKPISAKVQNGRLTIKLDPKSITVVSIS